MSHLERSLDHKVFQDFSALRQKVFKFQHKESSSSISLENSKEDNTNPSLTQEKEDQRTKLETPSYTEGTSSEPHQPTNFVFPKRSFGQKILSFQAKWFSRYRWLDYNEIKALVFCFLCKKADSEGKLTSYTKTEISFTTLGFNNWKDAIVSFNNHEKVMFINLLYRWLWEYHSQCAILENLCGKGWLLRNKKTEQCFV